MKCWHAYKSNPALVVLEVSSTSEKDFVHWQTFYPELKAGLQLFPMKKGIKARDLKYARVRIAETYGNDCKTYLNQVVF